MDEGLLAMVIWMKADFRPLQAGCGPGARDYESIHLYYPAAACEDPQKGLRGYN